MAIIHEKQNSLKVKCDELKPNYKGVMWTILICSVLGALINPIITFFGVIGSLVYLGIGSNERNTYKRGLEGETYGLELLKKLDDTYHIFNDLTVEFDGKTSQLDTVIVGDNCVLVMEIKNINGAVTGDIKDKNLTITKTGQKGGIYYKEMYNPHFQVKTHVYRLSNYLKEKNIRSWIDGIVLFKPHSTIFADKEILITNSESIIFSNADELLLGIKNKNGTVNKETKEAIVKALIELN